MRGRRVWARLQALAELGVTRAAACLRDCALVVTDAVPQIALEGASQRVVPLGRFRGAVRPIILAGSKAYLAKCMAAVKPYQQDLQQRGVSRAPSRAHLPATPSSPLLKALAAGP